MRAAPDALLDDGLLEVVVLKRVSKLSFLTRILPKVFSGTHVHEPSVSVFRAREVTISADRPFTMYADGDPIGELPVRVRALPGAITVLTPVIPARRFAFRQALLPSSLLGLTLRLTSRPAGHSRAADGGHARLPSSCSRERSASLSRRRGGGATSAPGKLLLALEPDALGMLASRLKRGSVLDVRHERQDDDGRDGRLDPATATGSSSCTTRRARTWRAGSPRRCCPPLHHVAGSRASSVCSRSTSCGWRPSPPSCAACARCCCPTCFATSSTATASSRRSPTAGSPRCTTGPARTAALVLNADDPLVADLGRERTARAYDEGDSAKRRRQRRRPGRVLRRGRRFARAERHGARRRCQALPALRRPVRVRRRLPRPPGPLPLP